MSKQNKPTVKSFFNAGDIPTEGNYVDLIDSTVFLDEVNLGSISSSGNIQTDGSLIFQGNLI